jgi:hypothetical protein
VLKVVCFGDSLTYGARDEFYRNYPLELTELFLKRNDTYVSCLNYGIQWRNDQPYGKSGIRGSQA